jgi:hypothetical protein
MVGSAAILFCHHCRISPLATVIGKNDTRGATLLGEVQLYRWGGQCEGLSIYRIYASQNTATTQLPSPSLRQLLYANSLLLDMN